MYGTVGFVPLDPDWLKAAMTFIIHPLTAPVSHFWNPNPVDIVAAFAHPDMDHPLRFAVGMALPIAACGVVTRDPLRVVEFSLAYVGIVLFAALWNFFGTGRHHGMIFLALIGSAWTARSQPRRPSWLLTGLLAISALAGLLTLMSEFVPFSQARAAALFIQRGNLADPFLIGSRDAQVSSVAGYLGRPVYYLECECQSAVIGPTPGTVMNLRACTS